MLIVVHRAAVVLPAARDCVLVPGMTSFCAGWAASWKTFLNAGTGGRGMTFSGLEDEFRASSRLPRLLYLKRPAADMELPAMSSPSVL